jgi:hypothetical protein
MKPMHTPSFPELSRRRFLAGLGGGFGSLALHDLLAAESAPHSSAHRPARARGGFLVTSGIKDGKVEFVEIESRLGEECRLRNPWGAECLLTGNDEPDRKLAGDLLRFSTRAGKRYRLSPP